MPNVCFKICNTYQTKSYRLFDVLQPFNKKNTLGIYTEMLIIHFQNNCINEIAPSLFPKIRLLKAMLTIVMDRMN